ncbi:peptide deformylase [Streptomonospora salina]|uniref:Peptide deformylase n=1 Tax=Streptomonospora salina TaxID=104205 RepID=A0A841EIU6_9ACTN|nr:peptide deformylase [Streptomonospora salina]MBB6000963.1 peptide deformylase [Streptomonospora salina]
MSESSATQFDGAEVRVYLQGVAVEGFPRLAPEARRGRVRDIVEVGAEVLHRPCRRVGESRWGGAWLASLIDDMFVTMYAAEGVGLAANQVGVDAAVFVYDCFDDDGVRHVGHVCNPVLEGCGGSSVVEDEGCLSVPGPHAELARSEYASVRGCDRDGYGVEVAGSGYFARCLQHETDHTLGRVYIDRLARRRRRKVVRRMERMRGEVVQRRRDNARWLVAEDG